MFHENLEQISPSSSFQILDVLFPKATVHDNTSCITRLLFSQVLAKKTPLIIIMHNGVSTRYPFRNHCDGQTTYCTVLYSCVNSLTLIYPLKMKKLFNMKTRHSGDEKKVKQQYPCIKISKTSKLKSVQKEQACEYS